MVNFDDLDPVAFGTWLSQLPAGHPLVCAARAAADIAEGRRDYQRAMCETAKDIAAATPRGAAEQYRDAVAMWRARAVVDGPGSAAAAQAAAISACVPEPRAPGGAELPGVAAALVAEARAFLAAESDAADRRLLDAMEHHWARPDGHDDQAATWRVR